VLLDSTTRARRDRALRVWTLPLARRRRRPRPSGLVGGGTSADQSTKAPSKEAGRTRRRSVKF